MQSPRSPFRLALVWCCLLTLACGDDPARPAGAAVAALELDATLPSSEYVGRLTTQLVVRAIDADGDPVPGVIVRFRHTNDGSTLGAPADTTDVAGRASPGPWTLTTRPGVDTIIVTVDGGPTLRVPMIVRAGPIARIETLVPTSTSGAVLENAMSGPAFRLYDRFDNVMPNALVDLRIESTPTSGALSSRLAEHAAADAQGFVHVTEWVPRHLGEHRMRAVSVDDASVTSAVLRRTVATPTCAPIAALPGFLANALGTLGADASQPCADSLDRWAFGLDAPGYMSGGPTVFGPTDRHVHRLVRAGSLLIADVIAPAARGGWQALLPPGEYESVASLAPGASGNVPYGISGSFSTDAGSVSCLPGYERSVAYVVPGSQGRLTGGCRSDFPDLGLVDAPNVTIAAYAAGAAGRTLDLTVTAIDLASPQQAPPPWVPILLVHGVTADGTRTLLQTIRATAAQERLQLQVPVQYDEVHVVVTAANMAGARLRFDVLSR